MRLQDFDKLAHIKQAILGALARYVVKKPLKSLGVGLSGHMVADAAVTASKNVNRLKAEATRARPINF